MRSNSLPLESPFVFVCAGFDFTTGLEFTCQQLRRERVEQMFLDRAFERARAELRIAAFAVEQFLCGGVHVEHEGELVELQE